MTPNAILHALEIRGKSQKEAADAIGLDPTAFNKVLKNKRDLKATELTKLNAWLSRTPVEAADSPREFDHPATRDSFSGDYFDVPAFDIDAAAGAGSWVEETPPEHFLKFRREWLRDLSSNIAQLVVLRIRGDSMWETLHDGDHALVDRAQTNPRREGLYVIRIDDVLQVKRLTMHPVTKLLTIKSDNPHYQTYENIPPDDIALVGRVVWIGRKV